MVGFRVAALLSLQGSRHRGRVVGFGVAARLFHQRCRHTGCLVGFWVAARHKRTHQTSHNTCRRRTFGRRRSRIPGRNGEMRRQSGARKRCVFPQLLAQPYVELLSGHAGVLAEHPSFVELPRTQGGQERIRKRQQGTLPEHVTRPTGRHHRQRRRRRQRERSACSHQRTYVTYRYVCREERKASEEGAKRTAAT